MILQTRAEIPVQASIDSIWLALSDITKVDPDVKRVEGKPLTQGDVRICEYESNGELYQRTERLIDVIPRQRISWGIESDSHPRTRHRKGRQIEIELSKVDDYCTLVSRSVYYEPEGLWSRIRNKLSWIKLEDESNIKILENFKSVVEP